MRLFIGIISLLLIYSCDKDKYYDGPTFLIDDFESVESVAELVSDTGEWSFYQNTNALNTLELETENVHTGSQSLKFFAKKTENGSASKSGLANNQLAIHEGKVFYGSAWFFIEDTSNLEFLFLFDLEESVAIGAGPGMRLALYESEGYLAVERQKMFEPTLRQNEESKVPFPRNEWVHVEVEFLLSRKKKGTIKVWQNEVLLIDETNVRTMPQDEVVFLQGTKGIYNSIQVGITANSDKNDATLYIDDIIMEERE